MKKSLIALTLAALPVAATADVTLYGAIKAGVQTYRSVEHREGKVVGVETGSEISDFGSKIGFKGQEDLGNGLKAVWQLEQGASVAGTNTGWGNKQSFVGLKGGFGTIRVGSLNSPLKTPVPTSMLGNPANIPASFWKSAKWPDGNTATCPHATILPNLPASAAAYNTHLKIIQAQTANLTTLA